MLWLWYRGAMADHKAEMERTLERAWCRGKPRCRVLILPDRKTAARLLGGTISFRKLTPKGEEFLRTGEYVAGDESFLRIVLEEKEFSPTIR